MYRYGIIFEYYFLKKLNNGDNYENRSDIGKYNKDSARFCGTNDSGKPASADIQHCRYAYRWTLSRRRRSCRCWQHLYSHDLYLLHYNRTLYGQRRACFLLLRKKRLSKTEKRNCSRFYFGRICFCSCRSHNSLFGRRNNRSAENSAGNYG